MYAQIPGLKVVQPYTAADAKGLLKSAIRDPNPVIVLENEILYGRSFEVPELDDFTVPIGKARIAREGSDVTIVSFGIGMTYALQAAEELAKEGISAEVIDLRSLRPMDTDAVIASVRKTNRCVTVEEGFPVCSIGNHISAVLMEKAFDYPRRAGAELRRQGRADALCGEPREARAGHHGRSDRRLQVRHLSLRERAMPINILMPALSPTMEEGTLAKWLVKEGDKVASGAILAEIETDKATMEFEAVDEGTVGKIVGPGGHRGGQGQRPDRRPARGGRERRRTSDRLPPQRRRSLPPRPTGPPAAAAAAAAPSPAPTAAPEGERVFASPLARRIAGEKGLDLAAVKGSGPNGRIVKADVEAARPAARRRSLLPAAAAPAAAARGAAVRRSPKRSRSSTPIASTRRSSSTGCARSSPRG